MRSSLLLAVGGLLLASAAQAGTVYVDPSSPIDGPGTNWSTAFHIIQPAIDAAVSNDTVLVTNGVYATGGKAIFNNFTNRIAIDKPITVQSVNGPDVTTIVGQGPLGPDAIRCAYVGTNAMLVGFTLTNGSTRTSGDYDKEQSGGGVWCENSAIVSNCTLSGNSACDGGGAYGGTLNNCIVYYNSAPEGPNHWGASLSCCCTSPDPGGTGNITQEPTLTSPSHIATNSPCVGAGSSVYASGTDIDGEPWLNPPSIGCDQPTPGSITGMLAVAVRFLYERGYRFPCGFCRIYSGQGIGQRLGLWRWNRTDDECGVRLPCLYIAGIVSRCTVGLQ
jgi:opacity protein-like surface antigen